jgi:hypothetical protein
MMPDAIRTLENSSGNGVPASIAALKNFADDEVVEELNRRFQNSRRFPQRLAITFALCGVRICQSGFPDDSSGQYQRRGYCKSDDWHSADTRGGCQATASCCCRLHGGWNVSDQRSDLP